VFILYIFLPCQAKNPFYLNQSGEKKSKSVQERENIPNQPGTITHRVPVFELMIQEEKENYNNAVMI
jgi:hypothetical protein